MSTSNTVMIACAYCKSDIESDSFFCDQCGKELLLCETCGMPGRDQWCEEDGGALVAARTLHPEAPGTVMEAQPAQHAAETVQPSVSAGATERFDHQTNVASFWQPSLRLVNANLNISLHIQHETILGRTAGPFVSQLGTLSGISGKHLLFRFDGEKGWTFQDTGSSNGTKYSRSNKTWQNEPKVQPHIPMVLEDNTFLLVANIEFAVHIDEASPASTQRI